MDEVKLARHIVGLGAAALTLWLAGRATQDCAVSPYLAENCLTLWVSAKLGISFTPSLRAVVLGIAGLGLLAGGYLVFRLAILMSRHRAKESELRGPSEAAGRRGG